jgi:hypothetical protein
VQEDWEIPLVILSWPYSKFFQNFRINFNHYWHNSIIFFLVGILHLDLDYYWFFSWQGFIEAGNFTDYPIWAFGLLMFFAVVPFFPNIIRVQIISSQYKSIGNIANTPCYTLVDCGFNSDINWNKTSKRICSRRSSG